MAARPARPAANSEMCLRIVFLQLSTFYFLLTFQLCPLPFALLEDLIHGRRVPASARSGGSSVDRRGCRKERRRATGLARKIGDDRHVFLPDLELHERFGVVTLRHHRPAHLKHPRTPCPFA